MNVPANLKYADSHEWLRAEPTAPSPSASPTTRRPRWATSCSSNCPQSAGKLKAGEACAVVESVKAASDVYAPIAGEVVAVNDALPGAPETLNADAYAAWLFRLKPADAARWPRCSMRRRTKN